MNTRPYLIVSAMLFLFVAAMHLLRYMLGWTAQLGTWNVPLWVSMVAIIVSAAFAVWALSLIRRH